MSYISTPKKEGEMRQKTKFDRYAREGSKSNVPPAQGTSQLIRPILKTYSGREKTGKNKDTKKSRGPIVDEKSPRNDKKKSEAVVPDFVNPARSLTQHSVKQLKK